MFGIIPAYGFFIRHARGIELRNVEVSFEQEDRRPAFVLDDVKDVEFHGVTAEKAAGVPTFVLRRVEQFRALHSRPVADVTLERVERRDF